EEARDHVLAACRPLPARPHAVADALGLVTAADIVADEDIPPFANTAMDGFAVRAADVADPPAGLRIVETIAAGHAPTTAVGPGEASRIMTGAVIPSGADAVVMVERTTVSDGDGPDGDSVVTVLDAVPEHNHIRDAGDDIAAGTLVFEAGTVLGAGHLGVLCSLGMTHVEAHPRPVVGVVSTGDELVDDGGSLAPGQIRDSNRRTLLALVAANSMTPVDLGLVPDDEAAITAAITAGVARCDALVTSGGVSMGDFDYVKAVLGRIGEMRWMQVAIKPAKPLAFGTVDGVPVFGLPGNPVSSMVSFELFARSGLRAMAGHRRPVRETVAAVAAADLPRRPDGKTHFMRVVAELPAGGGTDGGGGRVRVRSAGGQGSHMLWSMARANALAVVPDGDGCRAGDSVEVLLLDGFA
ncbi:MAG TPA: molybdopterin molybdenumtransferase MoeA, partial [Acidimicrobiaceae bacterium]|nr:molybdopterin molybdenumtransferase MoeA [Acidimicrobiaceae bacterium]